VEGTEAARKEFQHPLGDKEIKGTGQFGQQRDGGGVGQHLGWGLEGGKNT
jgi:hypothetical protein